MLHNPLLIVPVLMQFAFLWGTVFIGLLAVSVAMAALARTGGAYALFVDTLAFVIEVLIRPTVSADQIPAALQSTDTLQQVISGGVFSWQAAVLALLIAFFVLIGTAAAAYTKALLLGIIGPAVQGTKANILDMFRAGREYWPPVMRYYMPFAALILLGILVLVPVLTYMLGSLIATQGTQSALPVSFYFIVFIGALFILLRIALLFAEGIIIDGSQRPVPDSMRYTSSHMTLTLKVAALLFFVTVIVFATNESIAWIEGQQLAVISSLATLLGVVLYAVWRLWVIAFVVAVWRSRNPAPRTPRGA